MRDRSDLEQRRHLPLNAKILMSQNRIREWYEHWNGDVYVSFSGGKDSTVLAHLVHDLYPEVPLVFSNTGLEYPEVRRFAEEKANIISPEMDFVRVLTVYGYPIISKEVAEAIYIARRMDDGAKRWRDSKRKELMGQRLLPDGRKSPYNKTKWLPLCRDTDFRISHWCCSIMKKNPFKAFEKRTGLKPYIGSLAEESKLRELSWLQHGCNAFDIDRPVSNPLSFWTEEDILQYILQEHLPIASVYGKIVAIDDDGFEYEPDMGVGKLVCSGVNRTGCIFCGFSTHLEKGETKFQKLARTHPKQYDYCMRGGQYVDNPDYDPNAPAVDGDWVNWNPQKIWVPSKEGLGMKHVFDFCNELYGKDFIRYE